MLLLQTHWFYLAILIVSLAGLWLCDRRWKLAYFAPGIGAKQATRMTLIIGVSFFLVWDIVGIVLGIFSTNQNFTIGLNIITPNLPIEEVLFLSLLIYVSLLTVAVSARFQARRARKMSTQSGKQA